MSIDQKQQLEQEWHEAEHFARDDSSLIVGVYASPVFQEAEAYHLDALGDIRDKYVLDYGCGTGGTTVELLARGARVTAFDIAVARLQETGRRVAGQANGSLTGLVQCAAEMLPFEDGVFDAVFGKQILHHLDLEVAIPEIARVLRPGGRAVFLEPLIHNPILEGYRRLTPHLRSPTERALSMSQIRTMARHFRSYQHREFILLAILPVLFGALARKRGAFDGFRRRLQTVDRRLVTAWPAIGRFYWETVIVLER